ncbi:unnamed protein product [Pleuronectes platessa]|uniref:Uncharacterized protein n=1 Tax=Pleuronectes platessa TaxID=8262 RepID=A0A9N7YDY6_PLEPL|nr:unnamed protein product [Pleuronectes platessa]
MTRDRNLWLPVRTPFYDTAALSPGALNRVLLGHEPDRDIPETILAGFSCYCLPPPPRCTSASRLSDGWRTNEVRAPTRARPMGAEDVVEGGASLCIAPETEVHSKHTVHTPSSWLSNSCTQLSNEKQLQKSPQPIRRENLASNTSPAEELERKYLQQQKLK